MHNSFGNGLFAIIWGTQKRREMFESQQLQKLVSQKKSSEKRVLLSANYSTTLC